jgi:glycosyltransferase involved in cell wall biosynthesis
MKFHVVGLAHTKVLEGQFESCAFTQKVRKFGVMMARKGHEVAIYAPEGSEVPGCEVVKCLDETLRAEIVGEAHYTIANWSHPNGWKFLGNVLAELGMRLKKGDFICLIGGTSQKLIADAFTPAGHRVVEFGIGYGGSFAPFRVFESSAWMHLTYGAEGGRNPNDAKASWWDDVIPNYFESEALPFQEKASSEGYLAFMGRLNPDKGINVAAQVASELGLEFQYAGPENGHPRPVYGEYKGELHGPEKAHFLGNAKVVLCPSTYIEPFCGVAVEAQMCGTPVVATDWGAFRENIAFGRTGYRARTFGEFLEMTKMAMTLDRNACRAWAMQFDLGPIAERYDHYFTRLQILDDAKGWYA